MNTEEILSKLQSLSKNKDIIVVIGGMPWKLEEFKETDNEIVLTLNRL